jgi:type I restriction enzyme S subunit
MNSSNAMNRNAVLTHSWKKVKLGDILKRRRSVERIQADSDYKLVTIKLYHKGVVLRRIAKGSELGSTMSSVEEGDFVLSGIDARNGAFGIVPKELDGAIITNDFWCLEPDEEVIDKEFLLYLTSTEFFDHICKQSSDGTTQRIRLQKDKFFNYEIDLPQIDEQREILVKLKGTGSVKDKLNTELTHQLDTVKQLRQAFLREAMQGKLVEQNPNDEPASELLQTIKAEKERLLNSSASLGRRSLEGGSQKLKPPTLKGRAIHPIKPEEIPFEIPANWVWCRLGEIVENYQNGISTRGTNDSTSAIVLRLADIKNCLVDISDTRKINLPSNIINKHKLNESDILITRVNGSVELVGNFNYVGKHDLDITACDHFIRLKLAPSINSDYIYLLGKLKHIRKTIESNFKTTSGQKTINQGHVDNLLIPLPPLEEQQRIVNKLEQLMVFCDELEKSIKQSKEQNEKLLQQVLREALSGSSNEVSAEDLACVLA